VQGDWGPKTVEYGKKGYGTNRKYKEKGGTSWWTNRGQGEKGRTGGVGPG